MKKRIVFTAIPLLIILAIAIPLFACGAKPQTDDIGNDKKQQNIDDSEDIQESGQSYGSFNFLTIDEVLERAIYPLAVAEIEIIDTIPRDTYDKYESDLLFDMSYHVFYNAKAIIYYTDDDFSIKSEHIVFMRFHNGSPNHNSGDKILCTLMSDEEIYGDNYKNIYNPTSIFEIKSVGNKDIVIRKFGAKENLFDLELSSEQKESIISQIRKTDIDSTASDRTDRNDESEEYIAYYDDFIDVFVNYVKSYRENQKKAISDVVIETTEGNENE